MNKEMLDPSIHKLNSKHSLDRKAELQILDEISRRFFNPKRIYFIHGSGTRGGHYHENCHQILIPIKNPQTLVLEKEKITKSFKLKPLKSFVLIPKGWTIQLQLPEDSVTLALASETFEATISIKA